MIRARPPRSTAVALLQAQELPVSDITDEHLEPFFFVGSDGSPTGLVGLEIYGADALLRSLASIDRMRLKERLDAIGRTPNSRTDNAQ